MFPGVFKDFSAVRGDGNSLLSDGRRALRFFLYPRCDENALSGDGQFPQPSPFFHFLSFAFVILFYLQSGMGVRPLVKNTPFSAWLGRFFRKLGTRKRPGVASVALCRANCPHFLAKLAHGMALQPSWRPIGVRTFRNRGATRAEKHPISGMAPVFPATHAEKHPISGMAHGFSASRAGKHPIFGMGREILRCAQNDSAARLTRRGSFFRKLSSPDISFTDVEQ